MKIINIDNIVHHPIVEIRYKYKRTFVENRRKVYETFELMNCLSYYTFFKYNVLRFTCC